MGTSPTRSSIASAPVPPLPGGRVFPFRRLRTTALALLSTLPSACGGAAAGGAPSQAAVVDDAGRPVAVGARVERVISVVPSATELIAALGAADRLVARTGFDTGARVAHLPSLGTTLPFSIEAIVAREPQLVILSTDLHGRQLAEQLGAAAVPAYIADVQTLADVFSTTRRLGRLLGVPERGDSLARALETGIERVRAGVGAHAARPSVFYVVWHDPPRTAGPGTFIHELIEIAGGANLFADAGAPWPTVALEEVVRREPDYVVVPRARDHSVQPAWLLDLPGWPKLGALRAGRLVAVESDLFNRPGPHVVEAAETLASALRAGRATSSP